MNVNSDLHPPKDSLLLTFNKNNKSSFCSRTVQVISYIALGIFYVISAWLSPFLFTIGFFAGVFYSEEVRKRMTNVFKNVSWKWIIPSAVLLYGLSWPATITIQGFLAGLDLGARFSMAAQGKAYQQGPVSSKVQWV